MPVQTRTSHVLRTLALENGGAAMSVRDIVRTLGDRAFALLVALLGLPNCIPMVPPIPLVCGVVLLVIAAQMVVGRRSPWMPRQLLDRAIPKADVGTAVRRAMPWVERLERVSRPRLSVFENGLTVRAVGLVLVALALGLLVAAPIVGQIPLGIAVCLIGLGLVERDGIVVLAGVTIGGLGMGLALGFVLAIVASVGAFF